MKREGDRTYADAKTVSKLPKGMSVEQLTTAPIFWDMTGEPDWTAWERLSDRAKTKSAKHPSSKSWPARQTPPPPLATPTPIPMTFPFDRPHHEHFSGFGNRTLHQQPWALSDIRANLKPPGTLKKADSIAAWWATGPDSAADTAWRKPKPGRWHVWRRSSASRW